MGDDLFGLISLHWHVLLPLTGPGYHFQPGPDLPGQVRGDTLRNKN